MLNKTKILSTLMCGIGLGAALAACNGGVSPLTSAAPANQSSNSDSASKNLQDGFFALRMGSGFDSSSNTATSGQSCLVASADQSNTYIANPQAMITFDQVQDLSALENSLNVDVKGKYGGDRFSMSLSAQFANASKDDAYSTNVIYLYKYSGISSFRNGSLNQGDAALTPTAKSMVHTDQLQFRQMCGDSYVEQMDAGAVLGVRLSLSFNSHSDKEKFDTKFKATVGLADIGSSIKQAADNSNVHVKFSLSAIQLGGEPQKLNDIFGEKDPSGVYPYLNCGSVGGSDADACKKMTSAIISYAQTIKTQVSNSDGTINIDNLYYTNPVVSKYTTLGIIAGAPNPSAQVLQAMQDLTEEYDKTKYDYDFVNHYLTALSTKLDTPTKVSLTDASARLANQLSNVYLSPAYKLINCYKGYVSEECVSIKNNVEQGVNNYALTDVQNRTLDYLQHNSYRTDLYTYKVGDIGAANSYTKTNGCVLAPISSPTLSKYAAYCDGTWLPTDGDLKVRLNAAKGTLDISGLNYYSLDATGNRAYVQYPDNTLNQDSWDENYYNEMTNIYFNHSTTVKVNSDLGLTLSPKNDA